MHFLRLLNFCVFPSPHGRTFLCPLLVVPLVGRQAAVAKISPPGQLSDCVRSLLRPHGVKRGKGSLKMPCQVQVAFDVRLDCATCSASWFPTHSRISFNFSVLRCWRSESLVLCRVGSTWRFLNQADEAAAKKYRGWHLRLWDFLLWIRLFGVLVVVRSSYPSLWYIFFTSPIISIPNGTKGTTPNMASIKSIRKCQTFFSAPRPP